jgi:predicted metal-dependent enzyme (double-stranded beta helix superfamily)
VLCQAAPVTAAVDALVAAVDAVLADPSLPSDRARAEALAPAMAALLADPDPVPAEAEEPFEGGAVGNLLHADPEGRFHVLAVVFPEGTSSGVHHHGCWGVIGYLRGGDEETRYRETDGAPVEASRHVWHQGDVTYLLPDEGEGWHRVRNPGPGTGVSVHVLCRTPAEHPHRFWDRSSERILDFPFGEVAPGRWVATVVGQP